VSRARVGVWQNRELMRVLEAGAQLDASFTDVLSATPSVLTGAGRVQVERGLAQPSNRRPVAVRRVGVGIRHSQVEGVSALGPWISEPGSQRFMFGVNSAWFQAVRVGYKQRAPCLLRR